MERLIILLGRPNKSVTPTNYFFKVRLVGHFIPLIGGIGRLLESPLKAHVVDYHYKIAKIQSFEI